MINVHYILGHKDKKTKKYQVHEIIQNHHKWTCTCVRYLIYKDCKHIQQIKNEQEGIR